MGKKKKEGEQVLTWNNKLEKAYIDNIGSTRISPLPRAVLLGRYLQGCLRRTNWGNLNKKSIVDYLKKAIVECQGGKK